MASLNSNRNITASMRYFSPNAPIDSEFGVVSIGERPGDTKESYKARRHQLTVSKEVKFVDARILGLDRYKLNVHGFQFVKSPEALPNWKNKNDVYDIYYERLKMLVKKHTGATKAFVFSHLLRPGKSFTSAYAGFAHLDYGPAFETAWRRLLVARYGLTSEEASTCGLAVVNVWHPIEIPAYKNPLCLLNYESINLKTDAISYRYVGNPTLRSRDGSEKVPGKEAVASRGDYKRKNKDERIPAAGVAYDTLGALFNPNHQWVYISDQTPDTSIIFKQWDSRENVSRCTFHSSFYDRYHDSWLDCPKRKSFESRIMIVYGNNDDLPAPCL